MAPQGRRPRPARLLEAAHPDRTVVLPHRSNGIRRTGEADDRSAMVPLSGDPGCGVVGLFGAHSGLEENARVSVRIDLALGPARNGGGAAGRATSRRGATGWALANRPPAKVRQIAALGFALSDRSRPTIRGPPRCGTDISVDDHCAWELADGTKRQRGMITDRDFPISFSRPGTLAAFRFAV